MNLWGIFAFVLAWRRRCDFLGGFVSGEVNDRWKGGSESIGIGMVRTVVERLL